jgi:hypothetical protein
MARRHFKQPNYGAVKPVKKVEVTLPKPLTLDLRFQYREFVNATDATAMDNIANIVRWFESLVEWQHSNKKKVPITNAQAKLIVAGAQTKRIAQSSATKQMELFVKHIEIMEKYAANIVKGLPSIKTAIAARKEKMKIVQVHIDKIAPRFGKLVSLLHEMFPAAGLSIEVVPKIEINGKESSWKYDHELSRVFYSKKRALEMVKTIRKEGILRVALHEAFVLARAKAFSGVRDGNYIINDAAMIVNLEKLLHGVVDWAEKGPKPKKLVRVNRPKKVKKEVVA